MLTSHIYLATDLLTSQSDLEILLLLRLTELEEVDAIDVVAGLLEGGAIIARASHVESGSKSESVKVVEGMKVMKVSGRGCCSSEGCVYECGCGCLMLKEVELAEVLCGCVGGEVWIAGSHVACFR